MQLARLAGMDEETLKHIWRGALLHDVGKLGIPDIILLKTDKLAEEEWKTMRMHPVYAMIGCRILITLFLRLIFPIAIMNAGMGMAIRAA